MPAPRRLEVTRVKESVIINARELGLEVEVQRLDSSTRTVQDAATAVGCKEARSRSRSCSSPTATRSSCIASGAHRIDTDKLADALDVAEVRQASPDEVRAATGFAIGGVPPFGHGLPVIFDEALLRHERVWAAGGDPHSLFCADPQELATCTGAKVPDVGE